LIRNAYTAIVSQKRYESVVEDVFMKGRKDGNRRDSENSEAEKESNGEYACPKKLGSLIKIDRELPAEFDLPSLEVVQRQIADEFAHLTHRSADPEVLMRMSERIFEECFRLFPEETVEIIVGECARSDLDPPFSKLKKGAEQQARLFAVLEWYPGFREFRRASRAIANYFEYIRNVRSFDRHGRVLHDSRRPPAPRAFVLIATPTADYAGPVADRLVGTLFVKHRDRIRKCGYCSHIFWATRNDMRTCGAKCSNALRQRDYRNLSKEEKLERKKQRVLNGLQRLAKKRSSEAVKKRNKLNENKNKEVGHGDLEKG
jgi:hypothetical protein